MKKHELLAPAGDLDSGYAALYYGADAVYLGLKSFSARANAVNFSPEELNEFTAYAHHLGKKVYVTINTLIQEQELSELTKTLDICSNCHVDAIILQDLGVAEIIKNYYPELAIHASTQMAIHNYEGALALKKLGFSRVVLARELTLEEIKKISTIPDLEIEVFIHGALCYSYSGLCLFSSMESGRSANRGKCAYPCRALFQRGEKTGHLFSMKDMALEEQILKLPICSLKIEGRKKKALYVAAVVDYYRHILDMKKADPLQAEKIKQIFSRPWTTFHLLGKNPDVIDTEFVGHRGLLIGKVETILKQQLIFTPNHLIARFDGLQIDIPGTEKPFGFSIQQITHHGRNIFEAHPGQRVQIQLPPHSPFIEKGWPVYLASSSQVKGSYDFLRPKPHEFQNRSEIPVLITLTKQNITASSYNISVSENGPFEVAKDLVKMNQSIESAFNKYKDTAFKPILKIQNRDKVFVPVSTLNNLRRKLYDQIQLIPKQIVLEKITPFKHNQPQWLIKTDNLSSLEKITCEEFCEILVEISPTLDISQLKRFPKNKIRFTLPTVARNVQEFKSIIHDLLNQGYKKWEIGNSWGLTILPEKGIDLSFDSSLYMMNTHAHQMAKIIGAKRITLPIEDTLENLKVIQKQSPLPTVQIVYQDIPLFTSANCIKNSCQHCLKTDCTIPLKKDGKQYQARIKNCQLILYSKNAFYATNLKNECMPDFFRIDFVNRLYSPNEVNELIQKIFNNEKISGTHLGNLKGQL